MECEHHGGNPKHGVLVKCSLSCCHDNTISQTSATIFLLPEPASLSEPFQSVDAPLALAPVEFCQSLEPISPPPRISLFSL